MPTLTAARRMTGRPVALTEARLAPWLAGAVALVVYLLTLHPGQAFGDWGEMQTVPHVLGVAHPTGYPTYVLLGWVAQLVPIGSIALRANLLSAVLTAGAVAVAVAILIRLGVRPMIGAAAILVLVGVRTVWSAATVAEVNPLHLLLVALLLHRALLWADRQAVRDLAIGALLAGLALGNHLLAIFVVPCLAVFVVWAGRRAIAARPWILLAGLIAGLAGLSVYLYIPIAAGLSPPLPYNHPVTAEAVWWLVSGTQFRTQFDFLTPDGLAEFVAALPALWTVLADQATPLLPLLGMAGLGLLIRRRPAFGLTCAAILLTDVYFWSTYLRLDHYLLVAWLLLALGAAVALDAFARALASRLPALRRRRPDLLAAGVGLVLAGGLVTANWAAMDRSGDRSAEEYVDTVFAVLPPDAAILTPWDASTPLWHARFVLGLRPDVLVVDDTNIVYDGWGSREQRIAALVCERPVFILRLNDQDLEPTRAAYRLEPVVTVRVAQGGPSAVLDRDLFRVQPLDPTACAE